MRNYKATEALHVAEQVAAIRAALKKRGYQLRKRPKQAAWSIYITNDSLYQLTYQPAPISSWVLYPQTNDSQRQNLEAIIQRALIKQSANIIRKVS